MAPELEAMGPLSLELRRKLMFSKENFGVTARNDVIIPWPSAILGQILL